MMWIYSIFVKVMFHFNLQTIHSCGDTLLFMLNHLIVNLSSLFLNGIKITCNLNVVKVYFLHFYTMPFASVFMCFHFITSDVYFEDGKNTMLQLSSYKGFTNTVETHKHGSCQNFQCTQQYSYPWIWCEITGELMAIRHLEVFAQDLCSLNGWWSL